MGFILPCSVSAGTFTGCNIQRLAQSYVFTCVEVRCWHELELTQFVFHAFGSASLNMAPHGFMLSLLSP